MAGTLFIVGGGMTESADEIFSAFIARAGGSESKIAFVVTASGDGPDELFRSYAADLYRLGLNEGNCVLLPVYSESVRDERGYNALTGDADGLVELLEGVRGVWFTGGDQYYTAKAFLRPDGSDTALLAALRHLYESGGVIGGSSAGAAIMSRVMIGEGSNRGVLAHGVRYGYEGYEERLEEENPCVPLLLAQGLGFFTHGVVDQHFNARPRLLRCIEACLENRENARMGFAVSEDTALIYSEGKIDVLGGACVYIVDCTRAVKAGPGCYDGVMLHAIQKGDGYDTQTDVVTLARARPFEAHDYARDYVNNGIPGNPAFDEMMEKYMFRCADSGLYYSETKKLPCIKGAALYEADEKTYLVLPEYYRSPETRGYIGACASFANVGFSSRALIIAT